MMAGRSNLEPARLRHGRALHSRVQEEWLRDAEGSVSTEKTLRDRAGGLRRADIYVWCDDTMVAIAEVKASDWNAMTEASLKRNIRRQVRQVWRYIDSQLCMALMFAQGLSSLGIRRPLADWR